MKTVGLDKKLPQREGDIPRLVMSEESVTYLGCFGTFDRSWDSHTSEISTSDVLYYCCYSFRCAHFPHKVVLLLNQC